MIHFIDGTKTVTAAATPEVLSATSVKVATITIQALGGDNASTGKNTGKIVIGADASVDFTQGVTLGIPVAGATAPSLTLESAMGTNDIDLAKIWIKAGVDGEGVSWHAMQW